MKSLEVSGAVRPIYGPLVVKKGDVGNNIGLILMVSTYYACFTSLKMKLVVLHTKIRYAI